MSRSTNRLLSVAQLLVRLGLVGYGFSVAAMTFAVAVILIDPGRLLSAPHAPAVMRAIPSDLSFVGVLINSALMLPILVKLLAVIRAARAGDPFTRENGSRLRAIGWLFLTGFLIQTLIAVIMLPPGALATLAVSPWRGLAPVLLFFVVARIFDQGAEMRADLEGTV